MSACDRSYRQDCSCWCKLDDSTKSIREYRVPVEDGEHDLLRSLVEGTAADSGDEFFQSLVKHLATALGVRFAFVAEFAGPPGRVRTLAFWSGGSVLHVDDPLETAVTETAPHVQVKSTLEEVERRHITRTLEETNWKISGEGGAVEVLGLNPSTLRASMRKLGIKRSGKCQRLSFR